MLPVLVIFWTRPDTLRRNLEVVNRYGPRALYLAGDGPRTGSFQDHVNCQTARKVWTEFSWNCPVICRFPDDNHGAQLAIHDALQWFFEREGEGIVLEDDTIPTMDFFEFCEVGIERYRHNPRIFQISGHNPVGRICEREASYSFASVQHIWGFATWRRSWDGFSALLQSTPVFTLAEQVSQLARNEPRKRRGLYRVMWRRAVREKMHLDDNWDASWNLHALLRKQLAVIPSESLVDNIGLDDRGLHSNKVPLSAGIPAHSGALPRPLIHPEKVRTNHQHDLLIGRVYWGASSIAIRIVLSGLEALRRALFASRSVEGKSTTGGVGGESPYRTVAQKFWGAVASWSCGS